MIDHRNYFGAGCAAYHTGMIHDAQSLQIACVGHSYGPLCHREDDQCRRYPAIYAQS
jgi:hypothetical protein